MTTQPANARDMVLQLPLRHKKGILPDWTSTIHLILKGEGGGEFTVRIENDTVLVDETLLGEAKLVLKGDAKTYEGIELGTTSPQMAFMFGKISVSNLTEMGNVGKAFYRVHEMA
ncbi:hypothetical protein EP331_00950 [bacterium]|nr:MAG: hypothetical protein EP331_00950 [bacterium]